MKRATNIAIRYTSSVVALLGLFLLVSGSLVASDTPFAGTSLTTAGNVPPTQSVGSLTGSLNSSGTMTLSWTPVSGAVSYTIDRETISNGTWQLSYAPSLTGTTYVDSNYGTGGYRYRISAVNSIGVASSPSVEFPRARYAVIDLGANMGPTALSNTGYILLRGTSNGNYYRWSQGIAHALTLPYDESESTSIGGGISDNGDVAGYIEIYSPYSLTPVIWSGSSLTPTPLTTTALGPDPQDNPDVLTDEDCIDYNGTIYGTQSETNDHGSPIEQYSVYQGVSWANSGATDSLLAPITVQKVVNNPPFYTQTGTACVILNVAKNGHTLGQIENYVTGTGWVNTVDGIQVSFNPQSLNTDGIAIGTLGGTDVIYQNGTTQPISLQGSPPPQPSFLDINHATRLKHNGDGTTTTVVCPQIIGYSISFGNSVSLIQLNPDVGLYEDLNLNDLIATSSGFSSIQCFHINDSGAIVGTATYSGSSHGIMLLEVNLSCPIADTTTNFVDSKGNSLGIPADINPTHFFDSDPQDPTIYKDQPALVIFYKDAIDSSFNVQPFTVNLSFSELSGVTWAETKGPTGIGTLQNASHTDAQFVNPTAGGLFQFDGTIGTTSTKVRTSLILPLAGAEVKDIVSDDMSATDTFAAAVRARYSIFKRNSKQLNYNFFWNNFNGDYVGRPDNADSKTCVRFNAVNDTTGMGAVATWFGVPVRVAKVSNFLVGYAQERIGVLSLVAYFGRSAGTHDDASATASYALGWNVANGTKSYSTDTVTMLKANFYNSDAKNTRLWPNTAAADNHVVGATTANFNTQFVSPGFTQITNP